MHYLSAYNFLKKQQDGSTYKCCIETLQKIKADEKKRKKESIWLDI